jgi:hypothetical protein
MKQARIANSIAALKANSQELRRVSRTCLEVGLAPLYENLCGRAWAEEEVIKQLEAQIKEEHNDS